MSERSERIIDTARTAHDGAERQRGAVMSGQARRRQRSVTMEGPAHAREDRA